MIVIIILKEVFKMRKLKDILTLLLCFFHAKSHNKKINMLKKEKKNEKKLISNLKLIRKKRECTKEENIAFNELEELYKKYFLERLEIADLRRELVKNKYLSKIHYEIFDTIGYFGEKNVKTKEVLSALCFGTFFRDIKKTEGNNKYLVCYTNIYYKIYCNDWIKFVCYIMNLKRIL